MISHDKAITMHCAGPEGCGRHYKEIIWDKNLVSKWKMCVGKDCMAWADTGEDRGFCPYVENAKLEGRRLAKELYPEFYTKYEGYEEEHF